MHRLFTIIIFILIPVISYGNISNSGGIRPFISINKKITDKWTYNTFYAETIQLAKESQDGNAARDLQAYLQLGMTYKQNKYLSYTGGYVYQRSYPWDSSYVNENRLWQQTSITHGIPAGSMTHRFRFEERFIEDRDTHNAPLTTRLRYRALYRHNITGHEDKFKKLYVEAYNEFYFNDPFKDGIHIDSDWLYLGIGFTKKDSPYTIQLGPLIQWSKGNNGNNSMLYTFQAGASINLKGRKRETR